MKKDDYIHILSACDDGFVQHFGVVALSILKNTVVPSRLFFHLIDDGISEKNKFKIESSIEKFDAQIEFLKSNHEIFEGFYETSKIPVTTYYRLLAHQLLSVNITKVIYLDCDVIVTDDIFNLWIENIDNYAIAAVEDNHGKSRFKDLRIPETYSYFNAGVLIINLSYWRQHHIGEKVLEFAKQYEGDLIWQDQDALNAICFKTWKKLDPKWNVQTNMFELRPHEQVFEHNALKVALEQPSVIHFTTHESKPWIYSSVHPHKNEYYYYLQQTQWSDFVPKDKSFIEYLKRINGKTKRFLKHNLPEPIYMYLKTKKDIKSGVII